MTRELGSRPYARAVAIDKETENDSSINASSASEEVLQHFWDLASLSEGERLRAATSLVDTLASSQDAHRESSGRPEPAAQAQASNPRRQTSALCGCSPLVVYAVRRLVRGLASGRQAARQGFALALALLLARIDAVPIEGILEMIQTWLQPSNSAKGSDARDAILGQPFGYTAIVRSGRLKSQPALAGPLAAKLLGLMRTKPFLREACLACLLELLEALPAEDLERTLKAVEELEAALLSPAESATPEDLCLALRLWPRLPAGFLARMSMLPAGVPPPPASFFETAPVEPKRHRLACAAALYSPAHLPGVLGALNASAASHPRLHYVWNPLIPLLISSCDEDTTEPLEYFWTTFTSENLSYVSPERRFMVYQLFTQLLPQMRPQQLPVLFSANFQSSLTASLARPSHQLHAAARTVVAGMREAANNSPDPALRTAIAVLLQRNASLAGADAGARDQQGMNSADVEQYLAYLKAAFMAGGDHADDKGSSADAAVQDGEPRPDGAEDARRWLVEQLAGAAGLHEAGHETQKSAVHFLAAHAFFDIDGNQVADPELKAVGGVRPPVSAPLRRLCAARLLHLLERVGRARAQPGPSEGGGAELLDLLPGDDSTHMRAARRTENLALKAATNFVKRAQKQEGVAFAHELPDTVVRAVRTLRKTEAQLTKAARRSAGDSDDDHAAAAAADRGGSSDQMLALLQLSRWLQLYVLGDAAAIDPGLADELAGIQDAAFGKGKRRSDGGVWMDQLVDVCLSLSTHSSEDLPSAALRDATEAVFRAFAPQLTATGMEDLVRVIQRPDQPVAGGQGESDDEVFSDDSESGSSASEASGGTGDDVSGGEDANAESADVSGPDIAMEVRISDERSNEGTADPPAASEGTDDEDMTDEQMFKMDKMIAAVLRSHKDEKNSARRMQQALSNFKLRTLALLEIFARVAPGSPLVAPHLPALVEATAAADRTAGLKSLAQRMRVVVCKLCRRKPNEAAARAVAPEAVRKGTLAVLTSRTRAPKAHENAKIAADAALHYLFGVASAARTEEHAAAAADGMRALVASYLKGRHHRTPREMVTTFAHARPAAVGAALGDMCSFAAATRTSQYSEVLNLLSSLLGNTPKGSTTDFAHCFRLALPQFAASSEVVLAGESFLNAKGHGLALQRLLEVWQRLSQLLAAPPTKTLPRPALEQLQHVCREAHRTAATAKFLQISYFLSEFGKKIGLELGLFEPTGPKRTYGKRSAEGLFPDLDRGAVEATATGEGTGTAAQPRSRGKSRQRKAAKTEKKLEISEGAVAARQRKKAAGVEASPILGEAVTLLASDSKKQKLAPPGVRARKQKAGKSKAAKL